MAIGPKQHIKMSHFVTEPKLKPMWQDLMLLVLHKIQKIIKNTIKLNHHNVQKVAPIENVLLFVSFFSLP